jgi:hypothetical protein
MILCSTWVTTMRTQTMQTIGSVAGFSLFALLLVSPSVVLAASVWPAQH